ncbi:hypothetical protein AMAG_06601 [Allomyces macrogynus ATCC 38327]|uniref:Uncharacterized protein n=1 Tax=Allomyces macrogynus (strain ATCC 38327) TaxID=578462 RepID=A0A0L0SEL5_ALLM3|nr:hypothetical protein AMAG_06601 [Allomyces macrogynus ATCC 38327]|eukprot:KNE60835.1 hypothetical protein AMAG_06601 [Allomyces macrogynus ATCC 38327]
MSRTGRDEFRIAHIIFGTDRTCGDDGSSTRPGGDAAAFVYHRGLLYKLEFTLDDDEARRHKSVHFASGEGLSDRGDQGGEGVGSAHDFQDLDLQQTHDDHDDGTSPAYE